MMASIFSTLLLIFVAFQSGSGTPIDTKIVGGQTALPGQFPFTVSLRDPFNRHICGGSIIGNRFGISAAHCTVGRRDTDVFIVAGSLHRITGGVSHQVNRISYINYNSRTRENDICLLRTATQIAFNGLIQPIPLNFQHVGEGQVGFVSGWGSISAPGGWAGPAADNLQWVNKITISNTLCQQSLNPSMPNFFPVIDSFLCTAGRMGQGFCFGDSGGPLQSQDGSLIGIVSWAIPCALGHPDVYIRISPYEEWIIRTMSQV